MLTRINVEKYGGPPNYTLIGEEEEGLQKLCAGFQVDIAHPCTYSVGRWRDTGLFRPIDTSRLSNYPDVWLTLKEIPITITDEGTWYVPWEWGNSSVFFRTDLAPEYAGLENNSWKILFDPKYKQRLGTFDSVDGAVITAALMAGVADPFDMTDEEIEQVRALMVEQRPLLRFYWDDQTSAEHGLASGELVASYAWNSAVLSLKQQGLAVEYMTPKEGILTLVCGFMLMKEAPGDEQAAYDCMDAMLAPESGIWLIDNFGFGHSNRKAFDAFTQERLDELALGAPEEIFARSILFDPIPPERREKYIAMFEEVKGGVLM